MDKFVDTNMKNLGVAYPMQSKSVREKSVLTIKSLYGEEYTSIFQVPEIREKSRKSEIITYMNRYGVDDVGKIEWYCGQCNKFGNLGRWHKNHTDRSVVCHGVFVEYTK